MPSHPSAEHRIRRSLTHSAVLLLTLLAVLTACSAPATDDDAIPSLEENRLQPLAGEANPTLPVTVDSIVPVANRTAETPTTYEPVEVTDVSRILPLNGGIAEIVYTLGLGDNVVGRDSTATFAEAEDLPVVTQGHDISVEGVLSLHPTLVIADTWTGPYEAIEQLRDSGVTLVILDEVWSLAGMYTRITEVAEVLGIPERGRTTRPTAPKRYGRKSGTACRNPSENPASPSSTCAAAPGSTCWAVPVQEPTRLSPNSALRMQEPRSDWTERSPRSPVRPSSKPNPTSCSS